MLIFIVLTTQAMFVEQLDMTYNYRNTTSNINSLAMDY